MSAKGHETRRGGDPRLRAWGIAAGIAAIGLTLRLLRWTADELWPDEAFLGYVACLPIGDILPLTWQEMTPPLAHLLVAVSDRLFGPGEAALRLPSLIGGALLAPATYLAGRSLFTDRTGLIAAIFVALSPIHIYYSQIARAYALLPLLALASAAALHALTERRRRSDIPIHAATTAAAIWLHQWGVLLIPCAYIYVLAVRAPCGIRRLLISHGLVVLVCLPLLPAARPNPLQVDIVRSFYKPVWRDTPPALAIPKSLEVLWAGGLYPFHTTGKIRRGDEVIRREEGSLFAIVPRWVWRIGCWTTLAALLLVALLSPRDDSAEAEETRRRRALLSVHVFAPLLIAWIVSLISTPIYLVGRHDVMVLPPLALLAGLGAARLRRPLGAVILGAYVILAASTLVPFYRIRFDEGNRERAAVLLQVVGPGDVVLYTGYTQSAIEYYLRPQSLDGPTLTMPITMGEWRAGIPYESLKADPGAIGRDADQVVREARGLRMPEGAIYVVPSAGEWIPALWPRLRTELGEPVGIRAGPAAILRFGPPDPPK